MNDEHVYCTLCVNADIVLGSCEKAAFPEDKTACYNCPCYGCDCLDPEDSRTDRPKYQERIVI